MKITERTDSAVTIETTYRRIKDAKEVKEIFDNAYPGYRVVPMYRTINEHSFQPEVAFRMINTEDAFYSEYYVATIADLIDSGVNIKQFEIV